jgi:hypothetical protein
MAAAFVFGWDLYVALKRDWNATVSAVGYDFLKLHPMISFSVGVLAGHFLWPIARDTVEKGTP